MPRVAKTTEIIEKEDIIIEEKTEVTQETKEVKEVTKPTRKIAKQINRDELVICTSVTDGGLTYLNNRNGFGTMWTDRGSFDYISVQELITMKNSQPRFLNEPWIIIEDEDVVEYLGLKQMYKNILDVEEIEKFFNLSIDAMKEKIKILPKGIKETLAGKAQTMIKNGTLYDIRVIKMLEEELKVDLQLLMK